MTVRLLDVSLADVPSVTLAEQTIPTEDRQVPIPFSLDYDPSRIEPRHRYAVRAVIRSASGDILWTNDTVHPVLTQGAPSGGLEIRVVHVSGLSGEAETGGLIGPTWRLVQIETAGGGSYTPGADESYTIMFGTDGRYNGKADCNRYGGVFEEEPDGDLMFDRGLSTLAACPPPSLSDAFFGVLDEIKRYAITGDRLQIDAGSAGVLMFERDNQEMGGLLPQETGRDYAYMCASADGPFTFRIRTGPGEVALWLPERFEGSEGGTYRVLGQVRAASGAKYQDGPVTVWTKGLDETLLEVDGETFTGCTREPQHSVWEDAKLSGVDFRAVGQEPGWQLEIREGERITFVYAYGEREAITPAPEPTVADGRTVYRAETEAHDLTITTTDEPCSDAMSGERFEATVTVELDSETYRGCGRSLH